MQGSLQGRFQHPPRPPSLYKESTPRSTLPPARRCCCGWWPAPIIPNSGVGTNAQPFGSLRAGPFDKTSVSSVEPSKDDFCYVENGKLFLDRRLRALCVGNGQGLYMREFIQTDLPRTDSKRPPWAPARGAPTTEMKHTHLIYSANISASTANTAC